MSPMRILIAGAVIAAAVSTAVPSHAVRVNTRPLLLNRTAVSGYVGVGLPVGEFSDSRPGYGNHASGPLDWAAEIEYFAGRTWSIGFSFASTRYEDKSDPTLKTDLDTYSGFLRVIVPTASPVRPYLRGGMGGVSLEFLDPDARYKADTAFSFHVGGGLIWIPERWIAINAQALYYHGSTDNQYVSGWGEPVVVGFNVEYWSFTGGISLLFP